MEIFNLVSTIRRYAKSEKIQKSLSEKKSEDRNRIAKIRYFSLPTAERDKT